jgi:hypothetical protein
LRSPRRKRGSKRRRTENGEPQGGIDAEKGSEVEDADGLSPPSGNGEAPAPDAAPDKTKGASRSILGIVSGLASATLLVAGLALLAFYVLNQESRMSLPTVMTQGLQRPEIEAPQKKRRR